MQVYLWDNIEKKPAKLLCLLFLLISQCHGFKPSAFGLGDFLYLVTNSIFLLKFLPD